MVSNSGVIFWDLDGTVIDSVTLKGALFAEVFDDYPESHDALVAFHVQHGGLNRTEKIRRMGTEILGISDSEDQLARRTERFGGLVKERLHEAPLVDGALDTLQELATTYPMHVITAMPEIEALLILKQHRIDGYFETVAGFPTPKNVSVHSILSRYPRLPPAVVIGDSFEDSSTAIQAGIDFVQVRLGSAAVMPSAIAILNGLEGAAPIVRAALTACHR